MPSIPQSLLWISLVVLWLFVLVPMLINKRDTVRRTSDLALSTRVLNGATRSRLLRRGAPAAGHHHDPDWRAEDADLDEDYQDFPAEDYDEAVREAMAEAGQARSMMVVAPASEADTEPVYIDVDVVDENSGALPVGDGVDGVQESLFENGHVDEDDQAQTAGEQAEPQPVEDPVAADEYEYIDDTSGLEAEDDPRPAVTPSNRRRRLESTTAAAVEARKYRFRKRVLMVMAAIMVLTAVLSFTVNSGLWWACGTSAAVMVLYLAYLRRQTRIEAQVRRRRQQRGARGRFADGAFDDRASGAGFDVPSRVRRPGAVVLDIDDEDPMFEHLDEMPYSRRFDLPRAAGQ